MNIEDIKKEHQVLGNKLMTLLDNLRNDEATQDDADAILSMLETHLKTEEVIYKSLDNSNIEEVKKVSIIFSDLMIEYGEHALLLLQDISSTKPDDLDAMVKKIQDRITVEETILFPLYKKNK